MINLQIKTAAITTGSDSKVHDVFEVKKDSCSDLSPDHIQQHIVHRLRMTSILHAGDKRRRTVDVKHEIV